MSMTWWVPTKPRTTIDPCVEIGLLSFGDFAIRVSDFRRRTLVVTGDQMREFIQAAKDGRFDKLLERPR